MIRIYAVMVILLATGSASANENCTVTSQLVGPGYVFFNTGTYAGGEKKTTSFSVIECQKKDSPLYALVVPIVPGFGAGLEGDVRVGARFTCGSLDCDISLALYTYKVDSTRVQETGDLRVAVSKTLRSTFGGTLTPYLWLDEQVPLQAPRQTFFGGRIGMNYSRELSSLGTPTLAVDVSTWHYFATPTPGKTIVVEDLSLGFHPKIGLTDFSVGPTLRFAQGATDMAAFGGAKRWMAGGFVSFRF